MIRAVAAALASAMVLAVPAHADTNAYLALIRTNTNLPITDAQALQAGQLVCTTMAAGISSGLSFGRARSNADQAVANLLGGPFGVVVPGIPNVTAVVSAAEDQLC